MSEKAVIYARYSSDNQRDASIDQQVKECQKYADLMGFEVIRTYDDRALTGKTDKRPSFLRMIKDSAKGEFSYVIVYALDRFSRNKYDSAIYKQKLKENGVRVLSAMEHITDDPTGALMESILEGFAQYYSDELSQKIHRGLNDNAEKGIVNGSVPLGFRRGKDGHAEIVPEEAEIVREVFNRVAAGEQLIRIIEDMNRRGIKTKHGNEWNRSTFNKMLSNERYIGVYLYKDHRIEGGFPEIIDKELFDSVQMKIATKKNARGSQKRRRANADTYLLTGKLYCGHCKSPMVGIAGTSKSGRMLYYYTCVQKKNEHTCSKKNVRRDRIEREITAKIRMLLEDDELLEWMADKSIEYAESSLDSEELNELKRQYDVASTEKDNLMKAIKMGIITESTKEELLKAEQRTKELAVQIRLIEADHRIDLSRDDLISWLETFRDGDVDNRKFQEQMIDTFLFQAFVYDDYIKLVWKYTKEHEEVTIPFEINGGEEEEAESKSVRIDETLLHQSGHLRTPEVKFIKGYFVFDFPFAS